MCSLPDASVTCWPRAAAYAEAGADSLFVPGLLDLDVLATLTSKASFSDINGAFLVP